jgi:hypothetical protein
MTILSCVDRSQKFLSLLTRRKTANFAIVGIVLGCVRRTNGNKLFAVLLDEFGQVLAIKWRHIPCAAMRAFIVAHAGPLIGPYLSAAGTSVEIQKPRHPSLLRSQPVITTRNEIDKSTVTQILKLLSNLRFDVLVAGIKVTQVPLESVDFFQGEIAFPK